MHCTVLMLENLEGYSRHSPAHTCKPYWRNMWRRRFTAQKENTRSCGSCSARSIAITKLRLKSPCLPTAAFQCFFSDEIRREQCYAQGKQGLCGVAASGLWCSWTSLRKRQRNDEASCCPDSKSGSARPMSAFSGLPFGAQ